MSSKLLVSARLLSSLEVILGAAIVIGHNVFHFLPNEVPILFILGWISLRVRNGGWTATGLRRPNSWPATIVLALVAALLLLVGSEIVVSPLAARIWPAPQNVSELFQADRMDWYHALTTLLVVWTFAAFGEEMSYRGYLLTRAAEVGDRSTIAWWASMVLVAVLFGFGHFYKGPAGVIDSTWSGLVLGSMYLLAGRNLWVPILAHGLTDTIALTIVFMGWADPAKG